MQVIRGVHAQKLVIELQQVKQEDLEEFHMHYDRVNIISM